MNKVYKLWITRLNDYFEENKLKLLMSEIEENIVDFLVESHKKISYRKNKITLRFFNKDNDYIQYTFDEKDVFNRVLDSNFIAHQNFENIEFLMSKICHEIEVIKIKNHLKYAQSFEEYILAFLDWSGKSVNELGFFLNFDNVLQINTEDMEDFYIIPTELKEKCAMEITDREYTKLNPMPSYSRDVYYEIQLKEKGINGILGNAKYPAYNYQGFSFFRFDIEDLEVEKIGITL